MAGTQSTTFGLRRLQLWTTDNEGFISGNQTGTVPYAGSRIKAAQSFTPNIPQFEQVTILGDDIVQATVSLPPTTEPTVQFTVGTHDLEIDAIMQDTKVQTVGEWSHGVSITNKQGDEPNLTLMAQMESIVLDGTRKGRQQWTTLLFGNAIVQAMGPSAAQRDAAVTSYNAIVTNTGRTVWGEQYTDDQHGATQAVMSFIYSEYPLHLHRYDSNGTANVFLLEQQPINIAKARAYVNGTPQTITAVGTAAPYTATIGGTPSAGALIIMYESRDGI